jgi:hypothetical protein
LPDGGIEYGHPLSTDSLLATAEAHFDSALVYAHGDTAVMSLASVGLARVRLNRGHFTEASAAVAGVATSFVYNIEMSPTRAYSLNLYAYGSGLFQGCSYFNVADRDGGNGQNFVSAADPRLVTDTTIGVTCDRLIAGNTNGAAMNYPTKFGNPSTFIPLATGVEARLIEAEAALQANQVSNWAGTLDALRDAAPQTYLQLGSALPHLTSDSTTAAPSQAFREDVMFRERAFWLFGTGTRLGDMRRLIRQYHRAADSVFPAGTYTENTATNITSYGTDVSLTLPTLNGGAIITNPYYTGCLTSPATP